MNVVAIGLLIAGLLGCIPVDGRLAWVVIFITGLISLIGH